MYKKITLAFFLIFSAYVTIYPSKIEETDLLDYCYSLEKILSRNTLERSKNLSLNYKSFLKDTTSFGINKTKGAMLQKMIDQYKTANNLWFINYVPNQFYCLIGYWVEEISPGKLQSIFYEKSKQKINQYKDIKIEVDEFLNDINSEYKFIKKEIEDFF